MWECRSHIKVNLTLARMPLFGHMHLPVNVALVRAKKNVVIEVIIITSITQLLHCHLVTDDRIYPPVE